MRAQRAVAALALLAGLALASCGSTADPLRTLDATPSVNVSVPLSVGDCDGFGTCYAFGTTDAETTPTDAGQMLVPRGTWQSIPVPAAPDAALSEMSCWHGGCLVFGLAGTGNFVWRVHNASVATVAAPAGAVTVVAVSCFASASCGVLATTSTGATSFWMTVTGGVTWTSPSTVSVASDPVDSLACSGPAVCVATGSSTAGAITIATTDGGVHWGSPVVSSAWRALTSVFCSPATCVGLADGPGGRTEVTADGHGTAWVSSPHQPGASSRVLSCGTVTDCVATTETTTANPGLDVSTPKRWTPMATRYLPSGISAIGCSRARCVVLDSTSVATLAP